MNKRQLKKGFIQLRHFVLFVVSANYSTTKAETINISPYYSTTKAETINISPLSVIIHLSSSKAQGRTAAVGRVHGGLGNASAPPGSRRAGPAGIDLG